VDAITLGSSVTRASFVSSALFLCAVLAPSAGIAQTASLSAPGTPTLLLSSNAAPSVTSITPGFTIFGYGAGTTGGTGKPICAVSDITTPDDYTNPAPGSFRAIVEEKGNTCCAAQNGCTVTFDGCPGGGCSGTIALHGDVFIKQSNITIDGSTAKNHGIQFVDFSINLLGGNTIVRYLRHHGHQHNYPASSPWNLDKQNINIVCGDHTVLDHVSSEWGNFKNLTIYTYSDQSGCDQNGNGPPVRNVTVQYSILAEPIDHSVNILIGGDVGNITFYRNLSANSADRHPQFAPGAGHDDGTDPLTGSSYLEFINNIVSSYHYALRVASRSPSFTTYADAVGNYYQSGQGPESVDHKIPVLHDFTYHWWQACVGGVRANLYCSGNSDCPGSTCGGVTLRAQGLTSLYAERNVLLPNAGNHAADCTTVSTDQTSQCDCDSISTLLNRCVGGSNPGQGCRSGYDTQDCGVGGTCTLPGNSPCSVGTTADHGVVRANARQTPHVAPSDPVYPDVFTAVLDSAGATQPCRDTLDQRIVNYIRAGTGSQNPGSMPPTAFPDETLPCP